MNTARQPIVDLINEVIRATPPVLINASRDPEKARIASQLLDGGYLSGPAPARAGRGQLLEVAILDVTIEGRQLCDTLEEELRNSQFIVKAGKTLKKGTIILLSGTWGVLGGVLGALLIELALRHFKLKQ